MHILMVNIHIKPECVDAFIEATRDNASASLDEPGVARFDFIQQLDDRTRFMLIEAYRTEGDIAAHKETAHYNTWAEIVKDMFAEPRTRGLYRNCYPDDPWW
ncbi:MAG: antibiotic biosynthesis monooxygenase [Candidatus Hydrogenedentes bacterium]|nr:antibiotic biosynthesis monooxygenase [Candidatus Hydrogenedentota bacterium]